MLNPVRIFSVSQIHYLGSQNTLYVQTPPPLKKLIFNIKIPLVFLNKTLITIRLIRRHTFSVFQCCFYISITFFISYHSWTWTCHSFHTSFNCLSMDREVRNFHCECQSMQLGRLSTFDISHVRRGSWISLFQSMMSVISSHCKFIIGIMKGRTDLSSSSWAISVLVWPSINLLSRINAHTRPTTCYWLVSCELCTDTDHWRADLPNCNNLNPVFGDI